MGGVYFEARRSRNFIRPPFYTPPTPRRVFSGVGGWGCIKFGPVFPLRKRKRNKISRFSFVIIRESETTIKIKFAFFQGGWAGGGREENCPKRFFFVGKRHDNKILKVKILLSRNFVVMAQAPKLFLCGWGRLVGLGTPFSYPGVSTREV